MELVMSSWKETERVLLAIIAVFMVANGSAWGDGMSFNFSVATLRSNYTASPGPGGVVGTLVIEDDNLNFASRLVLAQLDLGDDGLLGGGGGNADTELDLAQIESSGSFAMRFVGTVIKLGDNHYQIFGPLEITDTTNDLNSPQFQGWFTSSYVSVDYGVLHFDGHLSVLGTNDSLLLPGPGNAWTYNGISGDTPVSPDEDGVRGRVTLNDLRTTFDQGLYAGGGYFGYFTGDMDAWFAGNRSCEMFDVQAVALPEPTTVLLAFMALGMGCRKTK